MPSLIITMHVNVGLSNATVVQFDAEKMAIRSSAAS